MSIWVDDHDVQALLLGILHRVSRPARLAVIDGDQAVRMVDQVAVAPLHAALRISLTEADDLVRAGEQIPICLLYTSRCV